MDYLVVLPAQLEQHLRSLRKSRGLTQAQLAQLLGVVQSRVADIEANPGAVSVEQLLQILGVLNAQVLIRDTGLEPGVKVARRGSVPARIKRDPPQGQW